MGAGSNRMNIYTVGAATQGLANYLHEASADLESTLSSVGQCPFAIFILRGGGRRAGFRFGGRVSAMLYAARHTAPDVMVWCAVSPI